MLWQYHSLSGLIQVDWNITSPWVRTCSSQAALRLAAQTHGGSGGGSGRNDEAEYELKSLRIMTQRMILTREEMVCSQFFSSYLSVLVSPPIFLHDFQCFYLRKRWSWRDPGLLGTGVYVLNMVSRWVINSKMHLCSWKIPQEVKHIICISLLNIYCI